MSADQEPTAGAMDNQLAKEAPKPKRKVGMVAVRTILRHPRRYGFVDNEHAHRYIHGMSRDALVQISTISDVDKGLVPADIPGADEAKNAQNREQGASSVGQGNVVDQLSASGIRGSVSDKVAGKRPATSGSLAAQPASDEEQSSSFYRDQNPSSIRDKATQPRRRTPPTRPSTLLQSEPMVPKIPSIPTRNESKASQKKASWRDPPTPADDPSDPLSKFYATGTYTRDSRAVYRLSNVSYAPSGQPDVIDLGSRILAKMSLMPQTKVFPRRAAVQRTRAAANQSTTASFGQPTIGAQPPPPHLSSSGAAASTVTAIAGVSAPNQQSTSAPAQLSLPPFHPPSMNVASLASFANNQANSGVSGQLSHHLPQGQANAAPFTNVLTSTRPAPSHHAMPPTSITGAVSSANIVSRPVSVSRASGSQFRSSSGQVNPNQANTITWMNTEGPATFAASRGGVLPPIRPSTLTPSQTAAHASADLSRPLRASTSGKMVRAPSANALNDLDRPIPTSTSSKTVPAAPDTNASTNAGHLLRFLPASFHERMATATNQQKLAVAIALHAATYSGGPVPASSFSRSATTPSMNPTDLGRPLTASPSSGLATAPAISAPPPAPSVFGRYLMTLPAGTSSSVSDADQMIVPRSSFSTRRASSSSHGRPITAPQLNTLVPGASALSPASRRAMLTADYPQYPAPTSPSQTEQRVEAMDIDEGKL